MQTKISTRHGHLGDTSQAQITEKTEKLLKFFDRITAIEVTVDLKDVAKPRVDIHVSVEHKEDFVAHDSHASLLTAVESTVHKLEQQLKKHKDKLQERHRNSDNRHIEVGVTEEGADEDLDDIYDD